MKCPVCGTENKSTNKTCFKCGKLLNDSGMRPKGNASSLWFGASEKKAPPAPPPFWGDPKGKPSYNADSEFIVLHDESSRANAAQDLVERGAPTPDNRSKLRSAGKREVTVIVPSQPAPFVETGRRASRYKVRWPRLVLATVAILAVFTGLGYGAYTLYRAAVTAGSQLIAEKRGNTAAQDPLVEKVVIDGEAWHRITFYGRDGDMVLVDSPKRSLPIQNGKAELLLKDDEYIPDDLTQDKVRVSLNATLITPDNKFTKLRIDTYEIDVPLAPLKIVSPQEQDAVTYSDNMIVKIKVAPGSSRVLIGEENVTDKISADGYVQTVVKLTASMINNIQVTIVTPKYRKNVYELKVQRPEMDVPITLDNPANDYTSGNTKVITGSTQPGAQITADVKTVGSITVSSSGIFHFTAQLKRWGYNDITITATTANGRTAKLVHTVNHEPDMASYTSKAWQLDYSYLVSAANNMIGTVYMVKGLVVKKLDSDVSDYYLFDAGEPGKPELLVVEYTKEAGLKQNQYYQLFADVTGTLDTNSMHYPVLTVRFLNQLPMPSGYGTQAPAGSPAPAGSSAPADSTVPEETNNN